MLPVLAFNLGGPEILLVVFLALLLFGTTRLPKLFRSMGQSVGEFKEGLKEGGIDDQGSEKNATGGDGKA